MIKEKTFRDLSDERKEKIKGLYTDRIMTMKQIAMVFNIPVKRVSELLNEKI